MWAPSIDATAAGTTIISDDSDNTASVSSDAAPSAHATVAVSDDSDMKATLERNTRKKIKALEDRLSKCSVSPIVNSQTGMQCHTTSGRSTNAQKLDGQTQLGLLPMPQTPPTDKSTTSFFSTTTDTTIDSSTFNSEQSKQLPRTK